MVPSAYTEEVIEMVSNDGLVRGLVLKTGVTVVAVLINCLSPIAFAKEVPYTLEDRDRLIRIETSLKEFKEAVDRRFEQVDKRFEQVDKRSDGIERRLERLETVMMWGFGLLFTSMVGMVGFVLWDRRTAVAPVARALKETDAEIEELKKREQTIEEILKVYAKGDQRLSELLKTKGLM